MISTRTPKPTPWSMKHEPNRTENLIDSQLERESFPEEFHPNNMEFVYDTRPCYRLGWAAGRPLSKAPFGYGCPKIRSLLSTEIAPCALGGRPFSCFVEWPPIWGWTCLGVEKAVAGRRGAFLLLLAIMVIISMYMIFFFFNLYVIASWIRCPNLIYGSIVNADYGFW